MLGEIRALSWERDEGTIIFLLAKVPPFSLAPSLHSPPASLEMPSLSAALMRQATRILQNHM